MRIKTVDSVCPSCKYKWSDPQPYGEVVNCPACNSVAIVGIKFHDYLDFPDGNEKTKRKHRTQFREKIKFVPLESRDKILEEFINDSNIIEGAEFIMLHSDLLRHIGNWCFYNEYSSEYMKKLLPILITAKFTKLVGPGHNFSYIGLHKPTTKQPSKSNGNVAERYPKVKV